MSWAMASGVRGAMTRTAVAAALIGIVATSATVPANATHSSDDPQCLVAPYLAACQGAPFGLAAAQGDAQGAMQPADPVCGGPAAPPPPPPPPPPPIASGIPGCIPGMTRCI